MKTALDLPFYAYARGRSAFFSLEYMVLDLMSAALPGTSQYRKKPDFKTLMAIRRELLDLLKADSANIAQGLYPFTVLQPESPLKHFTRLPRIIADGFSIYWRRARGKTTVFENEARELLDELPRYYRRNFHFQTDGYLSEHSADLYEHQVEMLFAGAADAMRRLVIAPLREKFGSGDGKGLTFLEVGAGTGRATRFVRLAFPKAKIVALDLSDPYLKKAQKNLERFKRIYFVQGDGADLPFESKHFDAVYSVFLYHELPRDVRSQVLAEQRRVLKPGGLMALVDSIQHCDTDAFKSTLVEFPDSFHEPFYRDYVTHPIEGLAKKAKFVDVKSRHSFFAKVCSGVVR